MHAEAAVATAQGAAMGPLWDQGGPGPGVQDTKSMESAYQTDHI